MVRSNLDGSVSGRKPGSTNDVVGQPGSEAQADRPGVWGALKRVLRNNRQAQMALDNVTLLEWVTELCADGRARLSEEDAGKLQVKYQSFLKTSQ